MDCTRVCVSDTSGGHLEVEFPRKRPLYCRSRICILANKWSIKTRNLKSNHNFESETNILERNLHSRADSKKRQSERTGHPSWRFSFSVFRKFWWFCFLARNLFLGLDPSPLFNFQMASSESSILATSAALQNSQNGLNANTTTNSYNHSHSHRTSNVRLGSLIL